MSHKTKREYVPLYNILSLFRWDREELRFSEKNQKAIDILRMSCLKLKSLVLCDRFDFYMYFLVVLVALLFILTELAEVSN